MSNLRQREPRYQNRALLDAVYQIPCQADWEHVCGVQSEPSHSNESGNGKSGARRSHDCHVAALCRNAHNDCDGNRKDRELARERHRRARDRTLLELFRRGLVIVNTWGKSVVTSDGYVAQQEERNRALAELIVALPSGRPPRPRKPSARTGHYNGGSTRSPSKIFRRTDR